jgi:hypothetical protein
MMVDLTHQSAFHKRPLTGQLRHPAVVCSAHAVARDRGKTCQRGRPTRCVSQALGPRRWLVDRRVRFARGDQVLIAAISGPTPKIVIIRFRL